MYSGTVEIRTAGPRGILRVPVIMYVTAALKTMLLSQTGLTFTAVERGATSPPTNFVIINTGQGALRWTLRAATLNGGNWLTVTPTSGVSTAGVPADAVTVSARAGQLPAGSYYGQIEIIGEEADNTPQYVSVVLDVVPARRDPGPVISPSGALFVALPGRPQPAPRSSVLQNLGATPLSFSSTGETFGAPAWFNYTPTSGVLAAAAQAPIAIQTAAAALRPGIYRGRITYQFTGGFVRVIQMVLVIPNIRLVTPAVRAVEGCAPAQLVPVITSLGASFAVTAAYPSLVQVEVADDCGDPLVSGLVVVEFSNGDPPLALTSPRDGRWEGTWKATASAVTLTARARSADGKLTGTAQVTGGVGANPDPPPVIAPAGVVSSAGFLPGTPLAPGGLISIFGSKLATRSEQALTLSFPIDVAGTMVTLQGRPLPLLFVSDTQINAAVPLGININARQHLIVRRGLSYSVPEGVTLANASPTVFLREAGTGREGIVVRPDFSPVTPADPARAGDVVLIFATGLGDVPLEQRLPPGTPAPVDRLIRTLGEVRVTIGGVPVSQVPFAGLAPGFVGLYQVNVVVPEGVPAGDRVPLKLTVVDSSVTPPLTYVGPEATLAVR